MRERQLRAKRRYKTGQWVEYDGLYSDDWGGDLLLVKGDLFPAHPHMGVTSWTYASQSIMPYARSPKNGDCHFGY